MLRVTRYLFMGQRGLETNCLGLILAVFGKICCFKHILVAVKESLGKQQNSIRKTQRKNSKWLSSSQLNQNMKVKIVENAFT